MHGTAMDILKVLVKLAIPLASFATGLRAASTDPRWLAKHPGLLGRALLTILVIVPVGAVAFLQTLAVPPIVRAGLTIAVIAVGIGPPAFLGRTQSHVKAEARAPGAARDAISFEVGLNVVLLALAIVYIPLFVAAHGAIFHHNVRLSPAAVARVVLSRALIPLAIGLAVARIAPRTIAPLGRVAGIFVQLVLLLVVVVAIIATWKGLVSLGARTWLTAAAIVLAEIGIGHAMGGPALETRRVLASFSAMRFPALALLFVHIMPRGREIVPVILAYVLAAAVFVAIHGAITSRTLQKRRGAPRGRGAPRMRVVPDRYGAT
jgi:BASS family bile acid:Na+ symporter